MEIFTQSLLTEETLPIFSLRKHYPSFHRGNTTHLLPEETLPIFSQRKHHSSSPTGNTTHLLTEETLLIFSQRKHYSSFHRGNTTHLLREETLPIFSQRKHHPSFHRVNTTHLLTEETLPIAFSRSWARPTDQAIHPTLGNPPDTFTGTCGARAGLNGAGRLQHGFVWPLPCRAIMIQRVHRLYRTHNWRPSSPGLNSL